MCLIYFSVTGSLLLSYFFFFKQKTAYELRISDWSSDVCSSDLRRRGHEARRMSERPPKRSFASRPADPESWIKAPDRPSLRADVAAEFTARLTIDVTA